MKKRLFKKRERKHISYTTKRRIVLSISLIVLGILFIFKSLNFLILSFSAIAFIAVFYITDHLFDLRFKARHYIFAVLISIASFLLYNLYSVYPAYDKFLHFVQPIMFASIFFHMTYELRLKLKWRLLFVFFIVTGSVGVFEIGEWTLDKFFDLDLQGVVLKEVQEFGEKLIVLQEPIDDTMIDMGLGILGAALYSISVYAAYRKKRGRID
jgi:hypothetical protein